MIFVIGFFIASLILFLLALFFEGRDDELSAFLFIASVANLLIVGACTCVFVVSYYKATYINKQYSTNYTANDIMFNKDLILSELRTQNHIVSSRKAVDITVSQ